MEDTMVDRAREVALKILYKIDKDEAYSNILLNDMINKKRPTLIVDLFPLLLYNSIILFKRTE